MAIQHLLLLFPSPSIGDGHAASGGQSCRCDEGLPSALQLHRTPTCVDVTARFDAITPWRYPLVCPCLATRRSARSAVAVEVEGAYHCKKWERGCVVFDQGSSVIRTRRFYECYTEYQLGSTKYGVIFCFCHCLHGDTPFAGVHTHTHTHVAAPGFELQYISIKWSQLTRKQSGKLARR